MSEKNRLKKNKTKQQILTFFLRRTFTEGYGDMAIESLIGTVTSLCAKKDNVPATCPTDDGPELPEDDECYDYQAPKGGALEWANEVNPPMVNEIVYSDLLFTSPSNQRVEGFPGTCYDIFGDTKFNDVCDEGFVFPTSEGEVSERSERAFWKTSIRAT